MTQRATFSCTALMGTNKGGILKPDENGYYTLVLGAFDFYNSAGDFYPFEPAKKLFKDSSSFMRRIANGACRAEYGHPKKAPGMTARDFIQRIMVIQEDKVCAHIKEVTVDYTAVKTKEGNPVIAIIGKVKPSGPYGQFLKDSLDNPDENVCFSVRSLTNDFYDGRINRKNVQLIVTYDLVNEPGISVANKYASPALECANDPVTFTAAQFGSVLNEQRKYAGMEDSTISVEEVIENFGWNSSETNVPPSLKW